MYDIPLTKNQVEKQLKQYQKINYNQFRWWRMYQPKNKPLDNRQPLRDRILNGDFDYSCYKAQQYLVEYQLNDIMKECGIDQQKYLEKTSVIRARRKRLIEDFEKDEAERLRSLTTEFTKYFRCSKEQVEKEMLECRGTLIELYYIIEDKYKIVFAPYPFKRRGRPKKLSI
tara:strand:- start:240 stop:752 length:513 start_codon:yes stop_codon:yes gene_type:complete